MTMTIKQKRDESFYHYMNAQGDDKNDVFTAWIAYSRNKEEVYLQNWRIDGGRGNDTLTASFGDDLLVGGEGNDSLYGRAGGDELRGGSGSDRLVGGADDDLLIGGQGADLLTGDSGRDVFQFETRYEFTGWSSQLGGWSVDTITDFVRGEDKIDLRFIDADITVSGNQAFNFFAGGKPFFTSPADLWVVQANGMSSVYADVNDDSIEDVRIDLIGVSGLTASDFLL